MQFIAESEQLDLFDAGRWPKRPYCSDDKTARYVRPLATALTLPYIQANPPHLRVWSIFDIDRPRGAIAWEEAHLPPPSWSSANRENGHAHLVWGLTVPVLVDAEEARQAPLRYLCAVESAFREKLEADTGFAGLITKNPAHPLWKTLRGPRVAYGLGELAEWVDLPRHLPKKRPEQIGLGRNVTLFDWLRHWAYKAIRRQETRNFVLWQQACYQKALERNGEFTNPPGFPGSAPHRQERGQVGLSAHERRGLGRVCCQDPYQGDPGGPGAQVRPGPPGSGNREYGGGGYSSGPGPWGTRNCPSLGCESFNGKPLAR